jgi:transposase-like protein
MARKKSGRRYSEKQKQEIIRRVSGGESQIAVSRETGIPAVTIGYWARKAKDGATRSATAMRKRGRRRAAVTRASADRDRGIVWALDGDVLVVRIPLRNFARLLAQKALAEI